MELFLPCLYAFLSCVAFSVFYNVKLKWIPVTCLGGALGWLVYLLLDFPSDVPKYFVATVVIAVYSEIMARICKVPATLFLTVAFFSQFLIHLHQSCHCFRWAVPF